MAVAGGAVVLATVVGGRAAPRPAARACPIEPTPQISRETLADVCIPDGFTDLPFDYFDDFSWRAFVSLVWPADRDHRGAPAPGRPIESPGPRVFETFKPIWEIFHHDGSPPTRVFGEYDEARFNPCGESTAFGDLTIGSPSGIDDLGQAGNGSLDPPLVAQNGRYVRTLTFFNQLLFDHVNGHQFYLRNHLPEIPTPRPDRPVIDFPMGSIAVKSAWVDVTGFSPALVARMYTRPAMVKRATGGGCDRTTIGLIGLHIAQKTPSRPQWIWSSFEQVDTVPPARPDGPDLFVLNDGTRATMPSVNPLSLVPLAPEPAKPFNVTRDANAPVLTVTDLTTFKYQKLLAGTPWRFYRLVVTQWPRLDGNQAVPVPATLDGTVPNTFPGINAFSAFANVTMETFDQKGIQLGCMNCHTRVRMPTDFMWTLFDHAYPPRLAPSPSRTPGDNR
jgi:hypothetical protein